MSGGAWISNASPIVLKLSTSQIGGGNALASTPYPPMPIITEWFISDTSITPGKSSIDPFPTFPSSTILQLLKYDPTQNNMQHVSTSQEPLRFGDTIYISAGPPNSPCFTVSVKGSFWGTNSTKTPWEMYRFVIASNDASMSGIVPPGYNVILYQPLQNVYLRFDVVNNRNSGVPNFPMLYGDPNKSNAGMIAFIPMESLWWTNAVLSQSKNPLNKCVQRSAEKGFTQGANNNNCLLGLPGSSLLYSICTTNVPTCTQNVLGPNIVNRYDYDTIKNIDSTWRPFNFQSDCVNFSLNIPSNNHIPATPITPTTPPLGPPSHIPFLTKQQLILIGILSIILIMILIAMVRS